MTRKSKRKPQPKHGTKAVSKQGDPADTRQNSGSNSMVIPNIPPTPQQNAIRSDTAHPKTPRWKIALEVTALIVAVAVLFVYVLQLRLSKQTSKSSDDSGYQDSRPYVGNPAMQWHGDFHNGGEFWGATQIWNSGKTPALNVEGCGDILMTFADKPITDDYPCPNPVWRLPDGSQPRHEGEEHSRYPMPPNVPGFVIESPKTKLTPGNKDTEEDMDKLVESGAFRIYFYGYIHYTDHIRPSIEHHTTFCGRYDPKLKTLAICEKHNQQD